ncbi:MAG: tetratricopeptide repeat protein [Candidatus Aminicenantes bacterium]|nr:MAG: tetratricopeptide repeat protein [Candidatus Aminicenantes bacterium]
MAIKRDKILKTAEKLVQKGKIEQAIYEYEKLLNANPDDTNTINRLGDLCGRIGEIDKAVSLYGRVAERFFEQGFLPKAIAIYKKINRLAPQRLDIFERLGELYVEQGLMVEAKSQFRMLADHYLRNDDIESAIRVQERLGGIDPDDFTTRLKVADMLLESGDSERAMEAYGLLGERFIQRGQLDEAERLFRRLLDQELPSGDIMAPICDRLFDAGRVTSAQELLTAGLAVSPDSIPLRTLQVRAYIALGESEKAGDLAREILVVDPDNPDVRGLVGNIMMSDGDQMEATEMMIPAAESLLERADYARAQKMLRQLVEIAPTDERILRLAIRAFRPSGDDETLTRLTASLAGVCYSSGQEDQAKRFYLELVAGDPTNELYRERLAQLDPSMPTTVAGDDPSVIGDDFPSEITFTIDGDEVTGGGIEVEPVIPEGLAFEPTERINEAAVFSKYGLNDKAISHLEEVVRRFPDHAGAREALAKTYLAAGQQEEAARSVEPLIKARRSVGDFDGAARLAELYGSPSSAAEDDDEIIIVDLDDDETSETTFGEIPSRNFELGDLNIEEMVATDMEDFDGAASAATAAEPEVVEEELVEISTGVDGPSFNELAQLDLFIDQELYEDAFVILDRLEASYPGDADLADRRRKLDGLAVKEAPAPVETAQPPAKVVEVAVARPPVKPTKTIEPIQTSNDLFDEEEPEKYFDLAKELEEELAEEEAMVEEATGRGKGEAMLDEVFREFQRGVAEKLSDDDSDTHFNLGIAYKEMELLEEAVVEFQISSHDPAFFVEACSMIGVCASDLGRFDEAAEWYQKALVAPDLSADARTALRYELALAFENSGEIEQAAGLFEDIRNHDPAYRDVSNRLAVLSQQQRQVN